MTNTLKELKEMGQSVWLDYIRRDLIENGELEKKIKEDGLLGMTSNPAIFEKAITSVPMYIRDVEKILKDDENIERTAEAQRLETFAQLTDKLKGIIMKVKKRMAELGSEILTYQFAVESYKDGIEANTKSLADIKVLYEDRQASCNEEDMAY